MQNSSISLIFSRKDFNYNLRMAAHPPSDDCQSFNQGQAPPGDHLQQPSNGQPGYYPEHHQSIRCCCLNAPHTRPPDWSRSQGTLTRERRRGTSANQISTRCFMSWPFDWLRLWWCFANHWLGTNRVMLQDKNKVHCTICLFIYF